MKKIVIEKSHATGIATGVVATLTKDGNIITSMYVPPTNNAPDISIIQDWISQMYKEA